MPLESATYISQLSATDPDGSVDLVASLDDHIRLLKQVLQNSINLSGKVNATYQDLNILYQAASQGLTHTELMYLNGVTSAIQTQLNGKEPAFLKNTAFNKNFGTGAGEVAEGNHGHSDLAPLDSPTFTGAPNTTQPAPSDSSLRIPTTAWVTAAIDAIPSKGIQQVADTEDTSARSISGGTWTTLDTINITIADGSYVEAEAVVEWDYSSYSGEVELELTGSSAGSFAAVRGNQNKEQNIVVIGQVLLATGGSMSFSTRIRPGNPLTVSRSYLRLREVVA